MKCPKQLSNETREDYFKRLNATVFSCAVCGEVFLNEDAAEPGISICKNCDQSGKADKFFRQ